MKPSLPIRKIRKSLQLSATQVGKVIGVKRRAIERKEAMERSFTGDELIKLRDYFQEISGRTFTIEELLIEPDKAA
jgi:transcriptional regulator with XRE-family HTH domain